LRQSEERFAKAFRASPAAFSITRLADGRFIDVNESFERLFGYRRDELIGQSPFELNMFPDSAERADLVQHSRKYGSVRNYELTLQTKSGRFCHVLFSTERIEIDGEECALAILIDITDRQRAEEQVRTLNAELEARVAERTAQLAVANQQLAEANLA